MFSIKGLGTLQVSQLLIHLSKFVAAAAQQPTVMFSMKGLGTLQASQLLLKRFICNVWAATVNHFHVWYRKLWQGVSIPADFTDTSAISSF